MNKGVSLLSGIGLGAAAIYLFDPARGNQRRAQLRDKAVRAHHVSGMFMSRAARDLRNRSRGLAAEARGRFVAEEVPDVVLVERVRAKLGRVVSHPRSIEVTASDGKVTLRGLVLAREADRLRKSVAAIRGVNDVENRLEVRESSEEEPNLQGGAPPGARMDILQRHWSPATRLMAGTAGSALAAYAAGRRDLPGAMLGAAGAALLARAATNREITRLLGTDGKRHGSELQETTTVRHAPAHNDAARDGSGAPPPPISWRSAEE